MQPFTYQRIFVFLLSGTSAFAQMGQPGGGFGEQPGGAKDTPEGPAEQAPEPEDLEAELTPPSWPGEEQVEIKFFEMHGYFRFRGLLFQNPSLGIPHVDGRYVPTDRPILFPSPIGGPLSEREGSGPIGQDLTCAGREAGGADVDCPANTLSTANLRFRMQPTINVTEEVRIKSQIDVLDNLVLGSTPEGYSFGSDAPGGYAPTGFFSPGQVSPESGRNSTRAAIRVKRAWGEVRTPLGELRFGRMPVHWGMGILANNGDCLDCDFGDSSDRLMFATELFDHLLILGHDWSATGPTSFTASSAGSSGGGQAIDMEELDDVGQFFFVVGHIDRPQEIQERIERGDSVLNYGTYFLWRRQAFDFTLPTHEEGEPPGAAQFVRRGAWSITPDVWVRLALRKLEIEFEGLYVLGRIRSIDDLSALGGDQADGYKLRQWAAAQRTTYRALQDSLRVGLEVGAASGDEAEMQNVNAVYGAANPQPACIGQLCPDGADTLSAFSFDPDYQVDLVLFRQVMGAVTNALYFRSFIQYDPVETFRLQMALIPSWALNRISTPGNKSWYGMELDTGVFYKNEEHGFHAGLEWGVFFSAGAFNSVEGSTPSWDAGVTQVLRGVLGITY